MSFGSTGTGPNPRREDAREKARAIREQRRKLDKRNRYLTLGIIALGSVAVIGIVAIVISSTFRSPSAGPLNMRSDGIVIGEGFTALETGALRPGQTPIATVHEEGSEVIAIDLYIDYFSPLGASFQEANGSQLSTWVDTGAATLEIHPLAILDRVSQGTKYSSRAANAAACVANFSPNQFFSFHSSLLSSQPEENSEGLSDKQLVALTVEAKVDNATKIRGCIEGQSFKAWVADARDRALTGPIPTTGDVAAISTTPTVVVNGHVFTGQVNDSVAFSAFVLKAAGASYNQSSSPTPTPVPSETTPAP